MNAATPRQVEGRQPGSCCGRAAALQLATILLLSCVGCNSLGGRPTQVVSADALYQRATVTYRLDSQRLSPQRSPAPGGAQPVSYEQAAPSSATQRMLTTISITFPHPDNKPGLALVEVVMEAPDAEASQGRSTRWLRKAGRLIDSSLPGVHWGEGVKEAWAMDIPQRELDELVKQLADQGYFTGNFEHARPGVELSTQLNGKQFRKQWTRVASLDALLARVQTDGKLVSATRIPRPEETFGGTPDSVAAYRQLIYQDQQSAAPVVPPQLAAAPPPSQSTAPAAVPASFAPRIERLPPVESLRR